MKVSALFMPSQHSLGRGFNSAPRLELALEKFRQNRQEQFEEFQQLEDGLGDEKYGQN